MRALIYLKHSISTYRSGGLLRTVEVVRTVEGFNILKTLYFNLSVRRAVEDC